MSGLGRGGAHKIEIVDEFASYLEDAKRDREFRAGFEDAEQLQRLIDSLVKCRKAHNLSQTDVANRMGVRQPTVSGFETEQGDPRFSTLQRYARAVGALIDVQIKMPADYDWVTPSTTAYRRDASAAALQAAVVRVEVKQSSLGQWQLHESGRMRSDFGTRVTEQLPETEPEDALDLAQARRDSARIGERAEIRDVRLVSSTATLERFPRLPPELTYYLNAEPTVERDGEEGFVVVITYDMKVTQPVAAEEGETEEEDVLTLSFNLASLFTLDLLQDEDAPTPDELRAFAVSTGAFALYPYAREYIYDVTGRVGLPPLSIGMLKIPLPATAEG